MTLRLLKSLVYAGMMSATAFLPSCQTKPSTENKALTFSGLSADSLAVTQTIHGFFAWYMNFINDEKNYIDFTDDHGDHLKLYRDKLKNYLDKIKSSGFVSDHFIRNEYVFYEACEKQWQQELIDEVPSCLDADKYFCAQDWDSLYYVSAPIKILFADSNKIKFNMIGTSFDAPIERYFECIKENGKWLIDSIDCDMGLQMLEAGSSEKIIDEKYVNAKWEKLPVLKKSEYKKFGLQDFQENEDLTSEIISYKVLDTLFIDRSGNVLFIIKSNGHEMHGLMVQYSQSNKMVYWDEIYYSDMVEYMKSIHSKITGRDIEITTELTSDDDKPAKSTKRKMTLSDKFIFERSRQ